jgi:hypothetical protein
MPRGIVGFNRLSISLKEASMAVLSNPANGSTHHHGQAGSNTFTWINTSPVVANGTHWRLKIGTAPYGYNKSLGNPIPFATLSDTAQKPALTAKLYGTVEWSTNNGASWNNGGTYTWYNCAQ